MLGKSYGAFQISLIGAAPTSEVHGGLCPPTTCSVAKQRFEMHAIFLPVKYLLQIFISSAQLQALF